MKSPFLHSLVASCEGHWQIQGSSPAAPESRQSWDRDGGNSPSIWEFGMDLLLSDLGILRSFFQGGKRKTWIWTLCFFLDLSSNLWWIYAGITGYINKRMEQYAKDQCLVSWVSKRRQVNMLGFMGNYVYIYIYTHTFLYIYIQYTYIYIYIDRQEKWKTWIQHDNVYPRTMNFLVVHHIKLRLFT